MNMRCEMKSEAKEWGFGTFCINSPRKEPFPEIHYKLTSGCWCLAFQPSVVNVVAFLRPNYGAVEFCLAFLVDQCVTFSLPLDFLGFQHGSLVSIRTNCLCSAASRDSVHPLLFPLVGHGSHLLALLSSHWNGLSCRASACRPIFEDYSSCWGSFCDSGLITGRPA